MMTPKNNIGAAQDGRGEDLRRLFELWFGAEAEAVASALPDDPEAVEGGSTFPEMDDSEADRLLADLEERVQRRAAVRPRPASTSLAHPAARDAAGRRRSRGGDPRRGGSLIAVGAVLDLPLLPSAAAMDVADTGLDRFLNVQSQRSLIDTEGGTWFGAVLLLMSTDNGLLVKATTRPHADVSGPLCDLIVEFSHDAEPPKAVRLTRSVPERDIPWDLSWNSLAGWRYRTYLSDGGDG